MYKLLRMSQLLVKRYIPRTINYNAAIHSRKLDVHEGNTLIPESNYLFPLTTNTRLEPFSLTRSLVISNTTFTNKLTHLINDYLLGNTGNSNTYY